ncbi:GDP-L-fucose synthase [Fibrobacterales bacterium]|nr:GDP-L-fucose synthase [Fibrobacterales bacterium]
MDLNAKIFIAGHRGLVGSAIVRNLENQGYTNLLLRTRQELDLLSKIDVDEFFTVEEPEYVVIAAAKVGGIIANRTHPVEFLTENLSIQNNIISAAHKSNVSKLVFLGSSCIYPKYATQPIQEDSLLTGFLEPTNDAYALAKIAGIKLCDAMNRQYGMNFLSAMPTNMYGPKDNFDLMNSHVLPAMIRKFHLAKMSMNSEWGEIEKDQKRFGEIPADILENLNAGGQKVALWGSGSPYREFLFSDDLASAIVFLLQNVDAKDISGESNNDHNPCAVLNVGYGSDVSIKELAETVRDVVGYDGDIVWDSSKPDGSPKKMMDSSKILDLGWKPEVDLKSGIKKAYEWYLGEFE